MIFVTSDLHILHKSILKFCSESRPFATVDEMHEAIVTNWNNKISADDTTYILGDITFGKISLTIDVLNRLNGKKILIKGNHDHDALRKSAFRDCFESIHDYLEIKYNGTLVCMFHYPIQSWNKKHYNSLMLHGHLHGNPSGIDSKIMDVGMDTNNCIPYSMDEVIEKLSHITCNTDHHGRNL